MADTSLTAEDICRNIPFSKTHISETFQTFQNLIFLAFDMFVHDAEKIQKNPKLLKRWQVLMEKLIKADI